MDTKRSASDPAVNTSLISKTISILSPLLEKDPEISRQVLQAQFELLKGARDSLLAKEAPDVQLSYWTTTYDVDINLVQLSYALAVQNEVVDDKRRYFRECLVNVENSKSRMLADLMRLGSAISIPGSIPMELQEKESRALAEVRKAKIAGISQLRFENNEIASSNEINPDMPRLVHLLEEIWGEMVVYGAEAKQYITMRRTTSLAWEHVQQLTNGWGASTALLSVYVSDTDTLVLLLRSGDTYPTIWNSPLSSTELQLRYRGNFEDEILSRTAHTRLGRPLYHRWRELGLSLFNNLQAQLADITHLVISPHGGYHGLPLHALWLDDAGTTLLDRCAVSYVPALNVLERLRRRGGAAGGAAVFGYTPNPDPEERKLFLGEAKGVAQQAGVVAQLDGAATSAALDVATAAPLRLLHLSCHGYFDGQDALRSGVRLADGVYAARRFLTNRLLADLVTLSACQTGISGSLGGDEMAGLSMALLTAGARSLLLGLWSVDARTTERLMVAFYERLWAGGVAGSDKAEALRQTMLALRDGRLMPPRPGFDPADPYYWAPFVLVGDWR